MPLRCIVLLVLAFGLFGCASSAETAPATTKPESTEKKPTSSAKLTQLQHAVEVARMRLDRARVEATEIAAENRHDLERTNVELGLARSKFESFLKGDKPRKIAEAQLQLMHHKDRRDDAVEELQQLEMMYKGDEIGDMTKEIVIRRARRGLDRMEQSLAANTASTQHTLEVAIPLEEAQLRAELATKEFEAARAESRCRRSEGDKRIAVLEAESALLRAETELADAQKGAS